MASKKQLEVKEQLGKRKQVLIRLDNDLFKDVKILAVRRDTTFNDLVIEALKDLLRKYSTIK